MAAHAQILLVDDDPKLTEQIAPVLERAGYAVKIAANGQAALDLLQKQAIDLVVLDVEMPVLNGRETLRRLRASNNWVPVIILSNIGSEMEQAQAMAEGADDYLKKPYAAELLSARIGAALRRIEVTGRDLIKARRLVSGDLIVDKVSRRVSLREREIQLTPKAAAVLIHLMSRPQEIFSRGSLLDDLWGQEYIGSERMVVDPRIAEVRKALGDDADSPHYIETVRGEGYRFIGAVEGAK